MDQRVNILDQKIYSAIRIPPRLMNNIQITTTGLGGIFVAYYSNSTDYRSALNSKVLIKFSFPDTDGFGRYVGDACGLEVTQCRGVKRPRNILKYTDYLQVVEKVNKWFADNEEFLYNSIENK